MDHNASVVSNEMNLLHYRERLLNIYGSYKDTAGKVPLMGGKRKFKTRNPVARAFLKPQYFYIAQK